MGTPITPPELYKSAIRTVTVVFGSLFNDIYVRKYETDGTVSDEKRKVSITFSPKEQYYVWISNIMRRPDSGTKVGIRMPRLSYELTGFAPDPQRQLSPYLYKTGAPVNTDSPYAHKVESPAAYEFNFTLTLWSNDMDTSIQVLESILPFFKPEVSVKVKEQTTLPIVNDIHVVFKGLTKQDNYTEGFEENRFIQWDIEFSVYSNIWAPTTKGNIITQVEVDLNDSSITDMINNNQCCYGEHHD